MSATPSTIVTVQFNPDRPAERFQAIAGSTEGGGQVVHRCANQGDMTAWLACHGYQWLKDTGYPQQWVKVA